MTTTRTAAAKALPLTSHLPAYLGAGIIALVLIFFAGFAETAVFHDSAHDARHSIGFACH